MPKNEGQIEYWLHKECLFVCVEVLWPSHGVMSSAVILPNHTFAGQT